MQKSSFFGIIELQKTITPQEDYTISFKKCLIKLTMYVIMSLQSKLNELPCGMMKS